MGFQISLGDGDWVWGSAVFGISGNLSRRAATALGQRRVCERSRADVFRHQGGMLPEPITRSLDLNDNGVVKQAIQQCRGDDWIAKHVAPLGKAAVRGEDHRAFLIAGVDQLEEQIAAAGHDRKVSDLVYNEEGGAGKEPQSLA